MNNQNLEAFRQLCIQLPYTKDKDQEICEQQIESFILDSNNFPLLQNLLNQESNFQVHLVALESINKAFTNAMNTETNKKKNNDQAILDNRLQYLNKLNEYLQEYYFNMNLNSTPKFIINTTANLIADNIKVFLSQNKPKLINLQGIFQRANNSDLQCVYKVFIVFDYILGNITINRNLFHYFTFKKMLSIFKFEYLNVIFDVINKIFYNFFENQIQIDSQTAEVFKIGVEAYQKCLSFQFQFSYALYQYELDSEDISTIIYPKEFGYHFSNIKILEIFSFILTQQIDLELSYLICQCLNSMVCSRESIIDDKQRQLWKCSFIKIFVILLQNTPSTLKFLNEKIDFIRKMSKIFGFKYIITNYESEQLFEQHVIQLSEQIIQISSNKIDSQIFKKLIQYIAKLKNFTGKVDQNSNIFKFLQFYFQYFFNSSTHQEFLKDCYKNVQEFEESVHYRFSEFKEIFDIDLNLQFLLLEQIFIQFEQNFQLLNQQNFVLYANQFEHFVLFFTYTFIKFDIISGRIDIPEVEDNSNQEKMAIFISKILIFEENLQNYMQGQDQETIKNIVMSNNYFLKFLSHLVLSNHLFNENLQQLVSKEKHFTTILTQSQQFQSPQIFFNFVCNKFLNQLSYQNKIIIQGCLFYLKLILETYKSKFKQQRNNNAFIDTICKDLIKKCNQFLNDKILIKLRKKVYEIISICYLDNYSDDYIQNSLYITKTIFQDVYENPNIQNFKKIFYDIQGIYQMCYTQKTILVFTKVSYPKVQQLLEKYGDIIIKDDLLVTILLKFYQKLLEHTSNKYSISQVNTIVFNIITDTCELVSELLNQINQALGSMNTFEQRAEFVTTNIKLVKNFLKLFNVLLKCSEISFSVFHFFGNEMFIKFINNIHNFIFLISDTIIVYFINEKQTLLSLMNDSVDNLCDFMIEFFTPEQIQQIFIFVQKFYKKNIQDSQKDPEKLKKFKQQNEIIFTILSKILTTIYEESQLRQYENQSIQKTQKLIQFLYPCAQSLSEKFLQINLEHPETNPEIIPFSNILFLFILVFQDMNLLQNLIQSISQHFFFQQNNQEIQDIFKNLCQNVEFNLVKHNVEIFQANYKKFQKNLLELFQTDKKKRKQSNSFSDQID